MAKYSDQSGAVAEAELDIRTVPNALVPREQEYSNGNALGLPAQQQVIWQEPQAAGGLNVTKILHSFRRRWLLALFVGLALAVPTAATVWMLFPSKFEVKSLLQFQSVDALVGTGGSTINTPGYRQTQVQLIKSQYVLTAAMRIPGISDLEILRAENEPIGFLQNSITVGIPPQSDLLSIQMTGEKPEQLVRIVRAITDTYLKIAHDSIRQERTNRHAVLKQTFDADKEEIRKKREQYRTLARRIGALDSNEGRRLASLLSDDIYTQRQTLRELEARLLAAEEKIEFIKGRMEQAKKGEIPEDILNMEIMKDPRLQELEKDRSQLRKAFDYQRNALKNSNDPSIRRLQSQLSGIGEEIDELKVALRQRAIIVRQFGELERPGENLESLERRVESLKEQIKNGEDELKANKEKLIAMSQDNVELESRLYDINQLEASNAQVNRQLQMDEVNLRLPPPIVKVEDAEMPEGASMAYRYILTTFLGLLCFGVGICGVVLLEYSKQRISTVDDVGQRGLGIRVLGTVPNLARLSRAHRHDAGQAVSGILAESIDSVRTMLLQGKRSDSPRVILVTSADENEGKTTVATHLAASLARAGRRTLLVDGDLRKPSIHTLFDLPLQAGLCEVLRGEAEIEAVIQPAQVEGMWLLLAGQVDQRSLASLAKENGEAAFRTLRADYDFVIIDSGPVLNFADTLLMGTHADAAVLTILRDVSQIPKVYEARERLEAVGVNVLGGVVGGVSGHKSRSYAALGSS